jgi:hypothetical protein
VERSPMIRKRAIQPLSESIWRRLNMYALAAESNLQPEHRAQGNSLASAAIVTGIAAAGGVGMLALAPSAEAKILYTPVHVNISVGNSIGSYHGLMYLDLNQDGIYDFKVSNTRSSFRPGFSGREDRLTVSPVNQANQIWGVSGDASALSSGVQIGANSRFKKNNNVMLKSSNFTNCTSFCTTRHVSSGAWRNVQDRYLGLKFVVQGKIHYGWARLTVSVENRYFLTALTGFAYETVPNRPIISGKTSNDAAEIGNTAESDLGATTPATREPANLGRLAQGASGLRAWRQHELISVSH